MTKVRRLRPAMAVAAMAVAAMLTASPAHATDSGPPAAGAAVPHGTGQEFVPGELIVRFRPGVDAADRAEVRDDEDARLENSLPVRGLEVVHLAPGESVRDAAADFEDDPDVLYAEPNFYYQLESIPDDTRFGELWGLHNTGQVVDGVTGTADADIDAPEAWDVTTGSSSVTVGVVDSGVAFDHPDLAPNLWTNSREVIGDGVDNDKNGFTDDWRGWDFVDSNDSPRDLNGHGTHVAGTIGARGGNGAGVAGVSWNSRLMPVRACNAYGQCASADVVAGLAYAADNGARVVNASFGSANFSQAQQDVITAHPGTLFVAAAGNEGLNLDAQGVDRYPCEVPADNVICVAATDQSDALASFSNYGATAVDLAAPGVNILSTLAAPDTVYSEGFESDIATRWTTTGTWARTNERAKTGSFSLADSPGANYQNNSDSVARPTNSFSLTGRVDCALLYQLRLATQQNDGLIIGRSTNGTSWTGVDSWTGSTNGAFVPLEGSLAALSGEPNAYFRFRMISDAATTDDGVHLDDVQVRCPATTYDSSDYAVLDGTSMATPHVTGTVALMWADTPGASVAELRQRLLANVDAKPSVAGKTVSGGRLNAAKAVEAAPPPSVATAAASAVSRLGARLNGTVDPHGHAVSYHFEYGTTTSYGSSTSIRDAGPTGGAVAVDAGLPLAAGTTYHYRLVATYPHGTAGGTVTGDDMQFTTPAQRPVVGSQPATAITATTATLNGTVDPNGLATTYHFEYGPTTSYGNSTPAVDAGAAAGAQAVTAALSDLAPGTTYHFRLVATNADGTTVSDDAHFTTAAVTPPLVALAPTIVQARSATLNGTVDARGKATTYHFEYGATTSYGEETPTTAADGGEEPVGAALSDLEPATTYHFRLVATNADGTAVSDDATFTTESLVPPVVALKPATAITAAGATVNGTVDPRGRATTYRFEYGTTTGYEKSSAWRDAGAGGTAVAASASLGGLAASTTYHVRLVATSADGTTQSADGTFTTPAPPRPPQASTGAASAISQAGATIRAAVNPNGQATTYAFQYGRSTAYGARTPNRPAGAGRAALAVGTGLAGLQPGTTYHYRVVATNATGTVAGADRVFTTARRPPPPPPPPAPASPAPASQAPITILAPTTLRLDRRGAVTIRLALPAGTPTTTGRVELFRGWSPATVARLQSPGREYAFVTRAPKRIGARSFATRPGQTMRLRVRLTRAGRRLVARRRSVKATIRVTVLTQVQSKQVRLKARRR